MDMDKTFLNKAHQLERRAETLSRQKKLDECIRCHMEAVELYKKCLKIGDNKSVLESIRLQKEWNERQITTLQLKKTYFKKLEKQYLSCEGSSKYSQKEGVENLEAKIFRNFETHDSLICYLAQKGIIDTAESHCISPIKEEKEQIQSTIIKGNKHPKNDSTVIEELKELSGQLRESVQGLLVQLDDRNKEIEQLKEQIKDLELERSYKEAFRPPLESRGTSSSTSPLTASPVSGLILDVAELKSLPQLEVISIPDIDLTAFKQFRIPEVNSKFLNKDH